MIDRKASRQLAQIISIPLAVGAGLAAPSVVAVASAAPGVPGTNDRLNNGIVVNVDTIKSQAGCTTKLKINPQLQSAAQRHTVDVLNNRGLDADIGADGSSVHDVRQSAQHAVARHPQTAAGMAPVIRLDHSTEQHGVAGMQLLAVHFQAEVIQRAERVYLRSAGQKVASSGGVWPIRRGRGE